jgi:hypothetical protein
MRLYGMEKAVICSLLLILFLCGIATAQTIQLTTTTEIPRISGAGEINATVTIRNGGDDSAREVYVDFIAPMEFSVNGFKMGYVNPEESKSEFFSIVVPEGSIGTYPLIVKVIYADQAGYSFSNIAPSYIHVGETKPPRVQISTEDVIIPVGGSGRLTATFTNLEDTRKNITASLILPDEFMVGDNARLIVIDGKKTEKITYGVEWISGIQGSFYAGAIMAEYYEEGIKYTVIRQIRAEINPEEASDMIYPLLVALFIVMIMIFWMRFRN